MVKIVLFSPALLFFKYCLDREYSLANRFIFDVSGSQSIGEGGIVNSFNKERDGTQNLFNATIKIGGKAGMIASSFNNKGDGIQNFSNATIIIITGCCCRSLYFHGIIFSCFFLRALLALLLLLTRDQHPATILDSTRSNADVKFPSKGTSTRQYYSFVILHYRVCYHVFVFCNGTFVHHKIRFSRDLCMFVFNSSPSWVLL